VVDKAQLGVVNKAGDMLSPGQCTNRALNPCLQGDLLEWVDNRANSSSWLYRKVKEVLL